MISQLGFDIQKFVADTAENVSSSVKLLSPYLGHFQVIDSMYTAIHGSLQLDDFESNSSTLAHYYLLAGCPVNLVKGLVNVMGGHFNDANIFSRRSDEAVRYSIFIRDNPEMATLWIDTFQSAKRKEFKRLFDKWIQRGPGKQKIEAELNIPQSLRETLNVVGPHANFALTSIQSRFINIDGVDKFRTRFHEIERSEAGTAELIQCFLLLLTIHFQIVKWWLNFSKLPFRISSEQKEYWFECSKKFRDQAEELRPFLEKHLKLENRAVY